MKSFFTYFILLTGFGLNSWAQTPIIRGGFYTQVNPSGPIQMMNVVVPGQTTRNYNQYFVVNIRNSCFGSEVRSTQQPLGPNALIEMQFTVRRASGNQAVRVEYPGSLAMAPGGTIASNNVLIPTASKSPTGMRAATYGNILRLEIPIQSRPAIDPTTGDVLEADIPRIEDFRFSQRPDPAASPMLTLYGCPTGFGMPPRCAYVTLPGPLTAKVNIMQPYGSYSAEMQVTFPGQAGFCSSHF